MNLIRPRDHKSQESITSIVKNDSVSYRSNKHMQAYVSNQSRGQIQRKITDDEKLMGLLMKNIKSIIKLQAWARGNRARRQFVFLKSKQIGSAKYFTMAELMETQSLSRDVRDMHSSNNQQPKRERRTAY